MSVPEEVDYTVVLVFPGFGAERESAEAVVESALDWLNTYKETPGFRFARPVSAHLEIVSDADEVRDRIEADESVAMILLHDLDDDERDALVRLCNARQVGACYTVDAPRPRRPRKEPMKVVRAHPVCRDADRAGRRRRGHAGAGRRGDRGAGPRRHVLSLGAEHAAVPLSAESQRNSQK